MGNALPLSAEPIRFTTKPKNRSLIQFEYLYKIDLNRKLKSNGSKWLSSIRYSNMEKKKLFQAPIEPEAPLVSKRGRRVIHISFDGQRRIES
ncbi:hypothetical protein CXB51_019162 [Gossypium anomalum]|uniref:Uncharacterized protein n=1 Tax=Gossypium anomalum TaxID=47600 RepID=A0A8J6CZK3_9ROSI|nr:hypothetical protein CXB51_019162 [Gossypium anomalum]